MHAASLAQAFDTFDIMWAALLSGEQKSTALSLSRLAQLFFPLMLITRHLHPDRHVSLLKTLQDRDEASSAHDTAMDPITRRLTPLLKNSAQLLDRM